jgi:hypothetical protein
MKTGILALLLWIVTHNLSHAQTVEPRFPGCEDPNKSPIELADCAEVKLFQFILSNFKHPDDMKKAGVSGEMTLKFLVAADGSIKQCTIAKGLGHGSEDEMQRVVKLMPKWTPGSEAGAAKEMEVEFTVKLK